MLSTLFTDTVKTSMNCYGLPAGFARRATVHTRRRNRQPDGLAQWYLVYAVLRSCYYNLHVTVCRPGWLVGGRFRRDNLPTRLCYLMVLTFEQALFWTAQAKRRQPRTPPAPSRFSGSATHARERERARRLQCNRKYEISTDPIFKIFCTVTDFLKLVQFSSMLSFC